MPKDAPPLIFSHREDNTQRVAAFDARARGLKLKIGMGIAEARAMHPDIEVIESDPAADLRLLEGLADWCDRYTPLVAFDGADGLFLDITGCAHLFGGERAMLDDLLARFFHQGFEIRAALASTPGAAWAAARFSSETLIVPGAEAELIAPLPLPALRLDPLICAGLESVGLRRAGNLMAGPRAPLTRRFGKKVVLRLDQALGHVEEPISPRLPVPPLSAERQLADPISLVEDIEALILQLAGSLKQDLERRGEGARELQLLLFRVDGALSRIAVSASRPLREPKPISDLFHERLNSVTTEIDAGFGFDLVRLSVLATASLAAAQADLGGRPSQEEADIALFADRVRARLGDQAILASIPVQSHLPERAVRRQPLGIDDKAKASPPAREDKLAQKAKERPIRMFDIPECIDVTMAEVPEGPPLHFRWRRASYRVARSEGPERIAPEWWHDRDDAQIRDYFRIEDDGGRRYWLFRQGQYGDPNLMPRWFLQGMLA